MVLPANLRLSRSLNPYQYRYPYPYPVLIGKEKQPQGGWRPDSFSQKPVSAAPAANRGMTTEGTDVPVGERRFARRAAAPLLIGKRAPDRDPSAQRFASLHGCLTRWHHE